MSEKQIAPELIPVLKKLQEEGLKVYTYTCDRLNEIHSLYWFENGRVLNIQPNTWRNKYSPDRYDIGVSYIPSHINGSGCSLNYNNNDLGCSTSELLSFRNLPTWVRGVTNYKSMDEFLKKQVGVLKFYELEKVK